MPEETPSPAQKNPIPFLTEAGKGSSSPAPPELGVGGPSASVPRRSPLDVPGIDLGLTADEIVAYVREGRERG